LAQSSQSSSENSSSSSKRSKIIPSAGETDLVHGIGDVKPDGEACWLGVQEAAAEAGTAVSC
jgi:hypothetical protein